MNIAGALIVYVLATLLFAWLTAEAMLRAEPELQKLHKAVEAFKKALIAALKGEQ